MSLAPGTLLVGLAVAAPSLWAALVERELPVEVALQRLVIILLVISIGGSALRTLFDTYIRSGRAPGHDFGTEIDRRLANVATADSSEPPAA